MEAISKSDLETGVRAILHIAEKAGVELPGILRADPMAGIPNVTFGSIPEALAADPDTYVSENAMRWKLRHRHENGLISTGAVVEKFNGTGRERAKCIIHHRKWIAHLRGLTQ